MGAIVAIGGGSLINSETAAINRAIVQLTGKTRPRTLFIPTASGEPQDYIERFEREYGRRLGCRIDVLYLLKKRTRPPLSEIKRRILSADLIYVGGGNTLRMLKLWRALGVDRWLKQAHDRGAVLSGLSAGAICWFQYGSSDSMRFSSPKKWSLIRLKGLGFVPATASPHHLREKNRKEGMKSIMRRTPGVGIALDDFCAIAIVKDRYRILSTRPYANAHKVFRRGSAVHYVPIKKSKTFHSLKELLSARL